MSNTTTTNTTTINTDSPSNYTVALDADNNIIWCSELTGFTAGGLNGDEKREAQTFVIGNTVTYLSLAFFGHSNVKNIFVYSNEIKDLVQADFKKLNQLDETTGVITNSAGDVVTLSVLDNGNYIFDLYKANRDITKPTHVSDFGVVEHDTGAINLAILYVTTYGGKLMFEKDRYYRITGPIRICPAEKKQNNTDIRNFEIDFNHCKIVISGYKPSHRFDENDEKKNTMIYVNAGFANEERIGIIQNLVLDTGTQNRIHTGMYLDSSSQISYKNIKILNTTRGIYIAEKNDKKNYTNEVFMDDITISKTIAEDGKISIEKCPTLDSNGNFDVENYFNSSDDIGLECHANDCHFSKIKVYDYVVGLKMIGGDNRIRDSIVVNNLSNEQCKYSVCCINGSTNFYIDCSVDNFYIGWMSEYCVPFFLTNCIFNATNLASTAYQFYIPFTDYSGGGIYATDCVVTGESDYLSFCNLDAIGIVNDINKNTTEGTDNNENQ